ncbi:XrtA-associated tyrosine autokinase [Desulfothermus naphthae]
MSRLFEALEKAEKERIEIGEHKKLHVNKPDSHGDKPQLSKEIVVFSEPNSVIAEEFRFLRSRILRPLKGDPPKTILITSCLQGEGKTFVASNLAATIAKGFDEYVLLVDADLRRPRVHQIFGYEYVKKGLSTHLMTGEPLKDLFIKTEIKKLTILPAGDDCDNPSELISSKKMEDLIKELKDRYPDRYVIFDSSPIELTPETFVLGNKVDAIYLIVKRASTPRDVVKNTIEKFEKERFKGIILNGYEKRKRYYKRYGSYRYTSY